MRIFNLLKALIEKVLRVELSLKHKDITSLITNVNAVNPEAHVENGMVSITFLAPTGSTGAFVVMKLPLEYAPRLTVICTLGINNSGSDQNKILISRVAPNGEVTVWISSALNYPELIYACYPIKR